MLAVETDEIWEADTIASNCDDFRKPSFKPKKEANKISKEKVGVLHKIVVNTPLFVFFLLLLS